MKILAIDSTAVAASAAVLEDDRLLGEFFIHTSLTHSQTLMPMVQQVLACVGVSVEDIDLFAAAAGPGSFTGVRIGVASIKGMAMAGEKPCVGVSTLEAMAYNLALPGATVCAVMDARRGQVYNAVFRLGQDGFERLTPDRAISVEALSEECKNYSQPLFLVGDGAKLCYNTNGFQELSAVLPPEPSLYQRAFGVGKAAFGAWQRGEAVPASELLPVYLRLPQAERELKKRQENQKEG